MCLITIPQPRIGLRSSHGFLHSSPVSDIKTFEPAGPTTSGNGYWVQMNFKDGTVALNRGEPSGQLYFAVAILQSARPILGERPLEEGVRIVVLMSGSTSSLVVDTLCDKAKEQNIAVACFYVDFAAREE